MILLRDYKGKQESRETLMKVFRVEHNYMHLKTELAMNLLQTTPGYQLSVSSVLITAMPAGSLLFVCLLLYVPCQQLWSWLDGQFTQPHFFLGKLEQAVNQYFVHMLSLVTDTLLE